VSQAKTIAAEEPESALALLDRSIKLSPTNIEARVLQQQLTKNTAVTPPEAVPPVSESAPPPVEPAKTSSSPTPGKRTNEPSTPRKTTPVEPTPPRSATGAGSSKALAGVLQLYKTNNFPGAIARADELAASAPPRTSGRRRGPSRDRYRGSPRLGRGLGRRATRARR